MTFPEAPEEHAVDVRMAERRDEHVAQVVGMELLVGDVHVEFRDAHRDAQRREAIVDRQQVRGRIEAAAKVRLHADAADWRALLL